MLGNAALIVELYLFFSFSLSLLKPFFSLHSPFLRTSLTLFGLSIPVFLQSILHLPSHASLQVLLRELALYLLGSGLWTLFLSVLRYPHFCIRLWLCNPTSVSWTFSFKSSFPK